MTAVNALLEGEVDYLETVPFDLTPMVKSAPDVELRILDKMGYQPMYRSTRRKSRLTTSCCARPRCMPWARPTSKAQVGDPAYYKTCGAVFGCGLPYASDIRADMIVPPTSRRPAPS